MSRTKFDSSRPCLGPPGLGLLLLALTGLAAAPISAEVEGTITPVGTSFSYQGFLTQNGAPTNGAFDFEFRLFDAPAAGGQLGAVLTFDNVAVSAGTFTVVLDWDPSFYAAGARWLQIGARPGASAGPFTTVLPRQQLTPAPVALSLPNVYTDQATNFVGVGRDFRISGNEVFGIRSVGGANQYGGMYVETSNVIGWPFYGYAVNGSFQAWTYIDPDGCPEPECAPGTDYPPSWFLYYGGLRLKVRNTGGLRIGPAADYSLVIENTTGPDGVRVYDTGDDAIQIGSAPDYSNYGVYIPSPGVSTYGLWPNTAVAAGEWALYTVDNIEAGNVFAAGFTQIARVAGDAELLPGDVVSAIGVGGGVPGAQDLVPTVAVTDAATRDGVIGVVRSRMALVPHEGKEGADAVALESVPGPAGAGDYVAVVVQGVTLVRVEPAAAIGAGDQLTAAELPGHARALRSLFVEGLEIAEGAPVLGVALGPSGKDHLIPVYVDAR